MLEALDVTKRFAIPGARGAPETQRTALDHVTLTIARGEIFGILGPTGCGKTTLLELLAGLQAPTEGRVFIDGVPALPPEPSSARARRAHRRGHRLLPPGTNGLFRDRPRHDLAVVFQDHAVFPWMTALGNVTFALRVRGVPRTERRPRALAALARVGLAEAVHQRPAQLSGGMRQRLALARALAVRAGAIFLDEPFASLDATTRQQLQDLLLELWQETRVTIVLVTHDVQEALYLCDRVALFGDRPGVVDRILPVPAERPRPRASSAHASVQELLARPLSWPSAGRSHWCCT